MSIKRNNTADLIQRLSDAKIINTEISLKATLSVISGASSSDEFDPLDFWCGTIRRPWVVVRPHVDVDQSILEVTQLMAGIRQQATKQIGARQANQE